MDKKDKIKLIFVNEEERQSEVNRNIEHTYLSLSLAQNVLFMAKGNFLGENTIDILIDLLGEVKEDVFNKSIIELFKK